MSNSLINIIKTSFHREKFVSIAAILVMTFTFLLLGTFVSVFVFSQTALKSLEEQAQITVFFKDDFPEAKIMEMQKGLSSDERILNVSYISKEDAYKIFAEINKDKPLLLESASASILPASLEIRAIQLTDLNALATELESMDGVEEVKFFKDVIDSFTYWSIVANIVGIVLVSIFLFISFSVIMVALKMTIDSKGTELEILKLVGASDSYVKRPLLMQGLFYAVVSALISSVLLVLVLNLGVFGNFFSGDSVVLLSLLPSLRVGATLFTVLLMVFLIVSSILLGYLGSTAAIKRYLKY